MRGLSLEPVDCLGYIGHFLKRKKINQTVAKGSYYCCKA
jgi:hypothetical protein